MPINSKKTQVIVTAVFHNVTAAGPEVFAFSIAVTMVDVSVCHLVVLCGRCILLNGHLCIAR